MSLYGFLFGFVKIGQETSDHCGDEAQGKKAYSQGFNARSNGFTGSGDIGSSESSNPLIRANEWNQSCYDAGLRDGKLGSFCQETKDHCDDEAQGGIKYHMGYDDGLKN